MIKIRVRITFRVSLVGLLRMYDEYHHTTTHARMMYNHLTKGENMLKSQLLDCPQLLDCQSQD